MAPIVELKAKPSLALTDIPLTGGIMFPHFWLSSRITTSVIGAAPSQMRAQQFAVKPMHIYSDGNSVEFNGAYSLAREHRIAALGTCASNPDITRISKANCKGTTIEEPILYTQADKSNCNPNISMTNQDPD